METVGWEITTAGWIILFLLAVLLAYEIIRLMRPPQTKPVRSTDRNISLVLCFPTISCLKFFPFLYLLNCAT